MWNICRKTDHIRKNWFYAHAACSYLAIFSLSSSPYFLQTYRYSSTTLGSTWILTLIASFIACYRNQTIWRMSLRSMMLGGSGLWIVRTTLPNFSGGFPAYFGWLRILEIFLIALCESAALMTMVRLLTRRQKDMKSLEKSGVPPLMIKAMSAEARFWRWVWHKLIKG